MAVGAVSLRKSHDIVILSFCNIVKDQAKYVFVSFAPLYLLESILPEIIFFQRSQQSTLPIFPPIF